MVDSCQLSCCNKMPQAGDLSNIYFLTVQISSFLAWQSHLLIHVSHGSNRKLR